jgi:hypothetical protein
MKKVIEIIITPIFISLQSGAPLKENTLSFPLTLSVFAQQKCIEGLNELKKHTYCAPCLTKSIHFLSHLHQQQYHYAPCNVTEQADSIQLGPVTFSHPAICSCLAQAIKTKSLKPIIVLLQYTQHNLNAHNNHFLHETLILIFAVYKHILFNECAQHHHPIKKSTLETIIAINSIINQLPIAEVLSAIDMLVNELPPFIEKYELNSKITWKNWLKKYWWVPPVFGVWFGLKILLKLQRPYYFYSPYLAPRPQIPLEPIITNDPALLEIRKEEVHS